MTDVLDAAEAALPVVGEVKAGLSLAKVLLPVIAAVAGAGAIGGAVLWVHGLQVDRDKARAEAVAAKAQATVQQGQAAAATQASQIVAQGVQQHDLTIHVQTENARAILAAPGAAQAIDAGLNAVGRRGLCRYAAYDANPECAGLRRPDPAPGQGPGAGNATPGG